MRESKAGPNFPIDEKNEKSYQFFFFFREIKKLWDQFSVISTAQSRVRFQFC